MTDLPANAIRFPVRHLRLIPKADCQEDRAYGVDPNDIIMADIEVLVAKSEALIGIERTNNTLPDRLLLVMAARSLSRK